MSGSCLYFSVGRLLFFNLGDNTGLPAQHLQGQGLGSCSQSRAPSAGRRSSLQLAAPAGSFPHFSKAPARIPQRAEGALQALWIPPAHSQRRRPELRAPGRWAQQGWGGAERSAEVRPYLGEGRVQVALQLVALMKGVLEPALRGRQGLLALAEGLQQLLPLVQHAHHQLLEVGFRVSAVGGAQRVPLVDRGHHLTHGGGGQGLLSWGWEGSQDWHLQGNSVHGSQSGQCQASGPVGQGFPPGISCSCSVWRQVPGVPLWNGA